MLLMTVMMMMMMMMIMMMMMMMMMMMRMMMMMMSVELTGVVVVLLIDDDNDDDDGRRGMMMMMIITMVMIITLFRFFFSDVSSWVASQQTYASTMMGGNGWSSGYTCQTRRKSLSNSHVPGCPECSNNRSTSINRRISLSHNVASVLPGGQLTVAPTDSNCLAGEESNGKNSDDSKHYEGDDETELDLSDFDIIKEEPFVRVREWLNSQNEKLCENDDSSDEEENTSNDSPRDIRVNEFDVISVPCSAKPTNSMGSKSIGYHSECEEEVSREQQDDKDSEFTMVHSSIGGLDWMDRDDLSSSSNSLHSAAIFLTYDVVEMIELRYKNVV